MKLSIFFCLVYSSCPCRYYIQCFLVCVVHQALCGKALVTVSLLHSVTLQCFLS